MTRPGWENADTCAQLRTRVQQLAASNWAEALRAADQIPLMWYRVQSLAIVAAAAPEERLDDVLKKALHQAAQDSDAYRRIAVLAWIMEAAISRGRAPLARKVLAQAIAGASEIRPTKSRAAALQLILAQATALGATETQQAADALLRCAMILAADPHKRWRKWGSTYVNRTVAILGRQHRSLAHRLLAERLGHERAAAVLMRHAPKAT